MPNLRTKFLIVPIDAMRGIVVGSLHIIGPKPRRESELDP